jgi:ubiquinone/menaquinone biosynthesis C-methylase UbiE
VKFYADHFSRLATGYAECRPRYPDELFDYLGLLVGRHELAWDCAAGSGQASLPLARLFRHVVATDASASMLDQAPRHPNIEYRVAVAESSGLADRSVDLVTAAQALHWLDPMAFYAEVERVLQPDGALAVWTYGILILEQRALNRIVERFYWETVGPYWPPERYHVESGYKSLPFPFAEIPSPAFEMQAEWTLAQLLGYVHTWSATQRYKETVGADPVEQLGTELAHAWGNPDAACRVVWPLSLRVGRAGGLSAGSVLG